MSINEIKPQEMYEVTYNVNNDLREVLNMYIEDMLGADGRAILEDVTEEETSNGVEGSVILSFNESIPFDREFLNEVEGVLHMLSMGINPIVE